MALTPYSTASGLGLQTVHSTAELVPATSSLAAFGRNLSDAIKLEWNPLLRNRLISGRNKHGDRSTSPSPPISDAQ